MIKQLYKLGLLALVAALSGCTKPAPQSAPSESRLRSNHDSRSDRYARDADDDHRHTSDDSLDHRHTTDHDPYAEGERVIKRTAQKAKRHIDDLSTDAEEVLHKTRDSASGRIRTQAQRAAELAAEALEEAKDRAEDLPEATDDVLQRQARRLRADIDKLEEAVDEIRHDVEDVEAKDR